MKVYAKVFNVNKLLMPYCVEKHISFKSDNVDKLLKTLHPLDKKLFNADLRMMSWPNFWLQALKGLRVYLVKDPMETVKEGNALHRRQVNKIVSLSDYLRKQHEHNKAKVSVDIILCL